MKISAIILSLVLSAYFSGSETAFVSISFIEAQVWLKRKMAGARWIFYFISHPDRYLITILIGNNIALITFTSITTYYLEAYLSTFFIHRFFYDIKKLLSVKYTIYLIEIFFSNILYKMVIIILLLYY